MIYFIQNAVNHAIKIGHSSDPVGRMATLQTASVDPLVMLGTIPGGRQHETELHHRFSRYRLRGEWFRGEPGLVDAVSALISRHYIPARLHALSPAFTADFFRRQRCIHPELCHETSSAVGFAVSIYWVGPLLTGSEKAQYQVMKWTDPDSPGRDFFDWHLDHCRQFFDTPEAACSAFVASHRNWIARWRGVAS